MGSQPEQPPAIEIGGNLHVSTYMANPQNVERKWYVIDAEGMVFGRLASQVASMLRGKHKPTFTVIVATISSS